MSHAGNFCPLCGGRLRLALGLSGVVWIHQQPFGLCYDKFTEELRVTVGPILFGASPAEKNS